MKKLILIFILGFLLFLLYIYNPFDINIFGTNSYTYKSEPVKKEIKRESSTQQKKTPQTYFALGEEHLRNRNIDKAILNFSKAIELDPNYAEAYKKRALAKDMKEDFAASKEDYEKYMILLEQQNEEKYGKIKEEITILVDQVREKIINKQFDAAIEESTNIIQSYPKYPDGYIIRADTYFSINQYKQALDDYKKALSLSLDNKNFNLYLKLADTEYELGLYKNAISNYLQVINLNANYEYAYYKLMGAYIFVEDFNTALDILKKYTNISKTGNVQVKDYSQWIAVLNKYSEDETIRDLKNNLKKLNFKQS